MKPSYLLQLVSFGALTSVVNATIEINSSAFTGVTNAAILTSGTSDWGYFSSSNGFFDSGLSGPTTSYNDTPFNDISNNSGTNLTTIKTTPLNVPVGDVTITEGTVAAGTAGTDTLVSRNLTSFYTFDGVTAFGSYGNLAPGEQDAWQIDFNDLEIGRHVITLY